MIWNGTINDRPKGPCKENWIAHYGNCSANNVTQKYYLDENSCGTYLNLPADNGTFVNCSYVIPYEDLVKMLFALKENQSILQMNITSLDLRIKALENTPSVNCSCCSDINNSVNLLGGNVSGLGVGMNSINSSLNVLESKVNSGIELVNDSANLIGNNISSLSTGISSVNTSLNSLGDNVSTLTSGLNSVNGSVNIIVQNVSIITSNITSLESAPEQTCCSSINTSLNVLGDNVSKIDLGITSINTSVNLLGDNVSNLETNPSCCSDINTSLNQFKSDVTQNLSLLNTWLFFNGYNNVCLAVTNECNLTAGGCTDDCSIGGTGCKDANTKWYCGEANDGDSCRDMLYQSCPGLCEQGICCTSECNANCPDKTEYYCDGSPGQNDVYQRNLTYQCTNPGTCNSKCEGTIVTDILFDNCDDQTEACDNGSCIPLIPPTCTTQGAYKSCGELGCYGVSVCNSGFWTDCSSKGLTCKTTGHCNALGICVFG